MVTPQFSINDEETLARFSLKNGGRWDFWLSHLAQIGKFIEQNHLAALDQVHLPAAPVVAPGDQQVTLAFRPRPYPGGIKIPHLHFKGDIYLLNQEEWNAFSKQMLGIFKERLANVKSVPFDTLINLMESSHGIG